MSLRAGIAGVEVTPDWHLKMECYPDGAPIERALDRLEARAIVLEGAPSPAGERTRAALVSVDACGVEAEWARAMLHLLQGDGRLPEGEVGEVHAVRLGRHWPVTTPGETAQGIGRSIERGLAELGLARPERGDLTLAVGYANGYVGYLCAASLIGEGGYEPGDYPSYGRPAPFAPEIEPALVNTVLSLAHDLAPER